jgi:hypothetical protein
LIALEEERRMERLYSQDLRDRVVEAAATISPAGGCAVRGWHHDLDPLNGRAHDDRDGGNSYAGAVSDGSDQIVLARPIGARSRQSSLAGTRSSTRVRPQPRPGRHRASCADRLDLDALRPLGLFLDG